MPVLSLYLVDDHQMLVDGLKALLAGEDEFKVIGESNHGKFAIREIETLKPDIVLTDINMPEMDGIELTREVKKLNPDTKVIALSMFGERGTIHDMVKAGVNGYILKNTGKEELIRALLKVSMGGMYFSDEVSMEMMRSNADTAKEIPLTPREIEIVELISKEMTNAEISEKLFISERTVETHRKNIFRKTDTKSVIGLLKWAIDRRLIEPIK